MAGKDVSFKISAKDEATSTLNKVAGGINSFGKETKEALKPLDNLNNSFSSITKAFTPLTVGITAAVAGIKKLSDAVKVCTDEWAKDELAMKRIDFAGKLNKNLAGATTSLKNLANSIEDMTNGWIGAGEVMESMNTLLYDKTAPQIEAIITAATDLSIAMGTDLETAVTQLNGTFSGTVGQLGKMFPEIKALTKEELAAGDAISIVAEKVKDASKAFTDSTESMKRASEEASNALKSALGESFTYLMQPMTNFFTRLKNNLADLISNANATKKAMREIEVEDAQTRYNSASVLRNNAITLRQQNADMLRNIALASGMTDESDIYNYIQNDSTQMALVQDIQKYSAIMNAAQSELNALNNNGYLNVALVDEGNTAEVIAQATEEGTAAGTGLAFKLAGPGAVGAYDVNFGAALNLAPAGSSSAGTQQVSVLAELFGKLTEHVAILNELMNPMTIVLDAFWQTLEPAVNTVLAPLVGILVTMGQTVGQILAPAFDVLTPAVKLVSEAFVWLYNNVIRPVGNGIIAVFNTVFNVMAAVANAFIAMYNAIVPKRKEISSISYKSLDEGSLAKIDSGSLATAGASYMGMGAGSSASYTAARDITVNLSYSHSFVNGDAQEIAIQIKKELAMINALGY